MLWVPAHRLVAVIDANRKLYQGHGDGTSITRRMNELRSGRQQYVSLETADRILTELDLHEWFYIPKEQGGLGDIYEDGIQYGKPSHISKRARRSKYANRYITDEERQAARKATYRAAYERRKLRNAA